MARGHLNLVGTYFEEMDDVCPGAGADLLALISHGVSREVRGETIYRSSTNSAGAKDNEINRNRNTWAAKAATRKISGTNVGLHHNEVPDGLVCVKSEISLALRWRRLRLSRGSNLPICIVELKTRCNLVFY
ncbi:Bgt-50443 [Blumeria graminis f. sp. tritici]|uniref:Bgt-50443 n=1 Tax=Blumeria graminis f. sp. tritici TaxID=62690 RepID=A0A9X9QFJ4_BLUGR|nr:Bgt-50443 [Blumeria graminis f. sp. tritici]